MKIGIFGCSFACEESNAGLTEGYNRYGRPWSKILRDDFSRDITNYAISASSVYYSYMKFKENYTKFDKIVFLVTYPNRKYCPDLEAKHIMVHLTDPAIAKTLNLSDGEQTIIKNYYRYFHNIQEDEDMRELIIKDIKRLVGGNLLYIDTPTTLDKVTLKEDLTNAVGSLAIKDHRFCHMSNENNYIFAAQVNDWLKGEPFEFNINKFTKPSIEELKSYYDLT